MATAGGGTKRTSKKRRKSNNRFKAKPKTKLVEPQTTLFSSSSTICHPHKHLSELIPLLISTTSAAHSFLIHHDLHLLPSQSLALESLLSSTAISLTDLHSLLSCPLPPTPQPPPHPLREENWFHRFLSSPDYDPRWVQFFNLSKPSFTLLLRLLTPSLASLHPLPPSAALAATLFRLAHAAPFSSIGRRFSIDSQTACRAFYVVCKAIVDNLGHLFEFNSDINRIIVGFGWISLPNCCGVLGIEKFELESGFLLVQALVDSEGRFLDVSAGWPGGEKPQDLLKKSQLYSGIEDSKEYLNGPEFELDNGNSVRQYILGNSYYQMLPWLLTPFKGELSSLELSFNEVHGRGMELVSTAFAKVKRRWKVVGKKWKEQCIEAFPFVIVSCCLLHNFMIKCSEVVGEENLEVERIVELAEFDGEDDESGKRTRDALASHLSPMV